MLQPCQAATLAKCTRLQVGMIGFVDPRFFDDFPSSMLGFENIPQRIHDLFDEWGQPIPIAIEFLEDELDLKARIIRVTMEPKAIDFDENDDGFDYVIDIEFVREVSYRRRRMYGVPPNYFLV